MQTCLQFIRKMKSFTDKLQTKISFSVLFLIAGVYIYNWLFEYLSENSILYAILLIVNQLYQSFDEIKFALGIFIHLSKTFDTVDRKILPK